MNSFIICKFLTDEPMMAYLGQTCCELKNKNIGSYDVNPSVFVCGDNFSSAAVLRERIASRHRTGRWADSASPRASVNGKEKCPACAGNRRVVVRPVAIHFMV